MNEPIISPWIFYLAYLAKMSFVLLIAAAIIVVTCSVAINVAKAEVSARRVSVEELGYQLQKYKRLLEFYPAPHEEHEGYELQVQGLANKHSKGVEELKKATDNLECVTAKVRQRGALAVVMVCLWVAIPSETTVYRMVAAQYVTPHNLQITGETIETVIDKVIEKIPKVKEDK